MHSLRTHPMVIAFAFILSILLAFFIGAAYGAEPAPVGPTSAVSADSGTPTAPSMASMNALGADTAVLATFTERARWNEALRWIALADVGSGANQGTDAGSAAAASPTMASPGPAPSGDCYDGSPVPASVVTRESGGDPNVWNQGGSSAWGCYQILGSTWNASCSDIGVHGSASVAEQKQCAARLPSSAWGY